MLQKPFSENYHNKAAKSLHKNNPKAQPIIGAIVQLYYFIVGVAAIPVRLLLRENFGERSISPMSLAVSLGMHIWYVYEYVAIFSSGGIFINALFGDMKINSESPFALLLIILPYIFNFFTFYLIYVFIIKGKSHLKRIVKQAQKNEGIKSSYYRGDGKYFRYYLGKEVKTPIGKFKADEQIIRMIIEPQKMIQIGLIFFLTSLFLVFVLSISPFNSFHILSILILSFGATGLMIVINSICLFLEELGLSLRIRNAALDIMDGEKDLKLILGAKSKIQSKSESPQTSKSEKKRHPVVKVY